MIRVVRETVHFGAVIIRFNDHTVQLEDDLGDSYTVTFLQGFDHNWEDWDDGTPGVEYCVFYDGCVFSDEEKNRLLFSKVYRSGDNEPMDRGYLTNIWYWINPETMEAYDAVTVEYTGDNLAAVYLDDDLIWKGHPKHIKVSWDNNLEPDGIPLPS